MITKPKFDESVFVCPGAAIVGDVTLGKNVNVWYNAVLRGDDGAIKVGDNTNVQDCAVLHEETTVGSGCTIGHGAIVHGCTVGDNVLIGMGAIHIYGAAIATISYCAVIMFLNIIAMHKTMDLPPRILKQFVKPMIATAVMAVAAYLTYEAVFTMLGSTALSTVASVCVAGCVYLLLVYAMKIITWEDCQLLPKSQLIAKILRITPTSEEE